MDKFSASRGNSPSVGQLVSHGGLHHVLSISGEERELSSTALSTTICAIDTATCSIMHTYMYIQ